MKLLVTGANGMLGTDLCELILSRGYELIPTSRNSKKYPLDITNTEQAKTLLEKERPTHVINCAAFTNVDLCETEKEACISTNTMGAIDMYNAATNIGAVFVQISTDFVFDGQQKSPYKENDETEPLSVYGLSKNVTELYLKEVDAYIVRTAWLYGKHGKSFPASVLRLAREGQPLRVVNDQFGSPTYSKDLAEMILQIIEKAPPMGVYHAVNSGVTSRFDMAVETLKLAGIEAKVVPVTSDAYPQPAKRPANSALSTKKIEKLGIVSRPWEEALRDYVAEIKTSS